MLLLVAVFLAASVVPWLQAADPPHGARRAVIVAINIYKWSGAVHKDPGQDFTNLGGAVNDGKWLKSILTTRFGFRDEDVLLLRDERATRRAIIDAFNTHLIAKSKPGDVAVFYFAGHGSRIATDSGFDETILPTDTRDPQGTVFDITTSELHVLFSALLSKTTKVTSILDSCHSGTAVRDAVWQQPPTRFAPPDRRARPSELYLKTPLKRGVEGQTEPLSRVVAVAAARADQLALEYTEGSGSAAVQHGLLSYALFTELQRAREETTWVDAMDRVRARVAAVNAAQEPQLETDSPNTLIFGGAGTEASDPYFLVTARRSGVELNGGTIHGLSEGTGLDVYPADEREFTREPIAKLMVTNLNDFAAQAKVTSGVDARRIPPGARAVVRVRPPGAFRLKVLVEGSGQVPDQIRADLLDKFPWATVVKQAAEAEVTVVATGDAIRIERPTGLPLSPPVATAELRAADIVVQQLRKWARWHEFLRMEGAEPVLSLALKGNGRVHPNPVKRGDRITLEVCNTSTRSYFVSIVDFSSDGSITVVPMMTQGAALELEAGKCKSRDFYASLPDDRDSLVDIFKAFATPENVDFGTITAGAIRASDTARWSMTMQPLSISRN